MRARLSSILPWLLAVALAVATFVFHSRWRTAQHKSRAMNEALTSANARATERRVIAPPPSTERETDEAHKKEAELMRLRSEVTRLREQDRDFQQLARQAEYWQNKTRELVTENNRLKSGSAALENSSADTQRIACLKNLSDLAAAKKKWAAATQVERGSLADLNEIVPYLPSGRLPFCPSGGTYQINRVGAPPVCSYAGHVLKE